MIVDQLPDSRPRVLHVVTRFAAGGSEQIVRDMVAAAPWADHDLVVGELTAHDALPAACVRTEPALRRAVRPWADAAVLMRLMRRIRRGRYDLVVTHQSKAGALGRLAAARAGVPVLHSLTMSSFGPGYGRLSSALFRAVERYLIPRTSAFAVVGDDLAEDYRKLGASADRFHVIRQAGRLPRPPVDRAAARDRLAREAGIDPARAVIAYVGSLEPRKNPLLLLDVLERARAHVPGRDPALVIAGDGPQREALQAAADRRGLTADVRLLGHLADPAPVFQAADVFVLLSSAEGLPQVLLQAAAAGVPYVSFDVSGARELVRLGAAGHVVGLGAVDAAAERVVSLLRDDDPAPTPIELPECRPEAVSRRYEELIRSLLPVPSPGGST